MRRIKQCFGVLALAALAAASVGAGSASAAIRPPVKAKAAWQAAIAHLATPGTGCYHASYPALRWHAVSCVVAPSWPLVPAKVGNGDDYSAQVSGLISRATGSFQDVSPGNITEKGKFDNKGSKKSNTFSLQLNTEFFSGSPACSGSADPANCLGWQQFVYAREGSTGLVFMQYWLIGYDTTCPADWFTVVAGSSTDCYTNSPSSVTSSPLTAKDLATVKLSGSATSGGNDKLSLSWGSGQATAVTNSDSMLHLAKFWNTTEWGVFGDAGGGEAYFGTGTALEAQTALTTVKSSAPACVKEGFTGETNNLKLTKTPALGSQPSPTMASKQTNGTTGTASCAAVGG